MRDRKIIEEKGIHYSSFIDQNQLSAILEALLDIRELLQQLQQNKKQEAPEKEEGTQ